MDQDDSSYYRRPTWHPGDLAVILTPRRALGCTVIRDNGLYVLVEAEGWLYTALWHYDDGVLVLAPNNTVDTPTFCIQMH